MDAIKAKQARRFQFLKHLYDEVQFFWEHEATSTAAVPFIDIGELGEDLGLGALETELIVRYLTDEGLVTRVTGGAVNIAHQGTMEVEAALTRPAEGTEHFPPNVNIVHAGTIINSPIQQGTVGSTGVVIAPSDLVLMENFLGELKGILPDLPLDEEESAEASAEIATLEAQMHSPRPKSNIIKSALSTLRGIFQAIAVKVTVDLVKEKLPLLIEELGQWVSRLS